MLTVILDMVFSDEGLNDFLAMAEAGLPETRQFKGCLSLTVLQNQDDPRRITFYEQWESRADYDAYLAWRERQGMVEAMLQQSSEPPQWRYFSTLNI